MHHRSFVHQPALDGLRAVAVVLVLLFHAGLSFVPAGYLGVSVFFTLSGYLITTLLLGEHESTGRVRVGAFWARRLRRLLPASLLAIAGIIVARQFGAFDRVEHLRGDILGANLQVFNWVKLSGSSSYGDLFGGVTSPLEHYWSLAIEEQFYWFWPLALWGLMALARRRRWSILSLVGALTIAVSATAVAIAVFVGPDAAYWATPARLPEILVGASLACWLADRRSVVRRTAWMAPCALAIVVVLSCTWPSASGPAYEGALPAFALISAALILGLQSPGWLRTSLSLRPVVWIGRVSYGLYLFHWPVFVLLRERGFDLTTPPDLLLALATTFTLAALSFWLVEAPARAARWSVKVTARSAALAGVAALAATQLVAPSTPFIQADDQLLSAAAIAPVESLVPLVVPTSTSDVPPSIVLPSTATATVPALDVTDAAETAVGAVRVSGDPDAATATTAPTEPAEVDQLALVASPPTSFPVTVAYSTPPPRAVRVLVVGDSTALYVGQGLASWSLAHPEAAQVNVTWCQGCSFMLEPEVTSFDLDDLLENSRDTVDRRLPDAIRTLQPDVVVLMVTVNDVANRQWSVDEGPLTPFDPRFVERMTIAYADVTMNVLADGVPQVAWIVPPRPNHLWHESDLNEMDRYPVQHQVIRDVAAKFDHGVSVVELDAWLTAAGHDDDPWWRNDGVHMTDESAAAMAEQYLGPLLVQQALQP